MPRRLSSISLEAALNGKNWQALTYCPQNSQNSGVLAVLRAIGISKYFPLRVVLF